MTGPASRPQGDVPIGRTAISLEEARTALEQLAQCSGRLAALVAGLPQGVVVCGADHRVVLCNERVARMLGAPEAAEGQSIFTLLDEDHVLHALDRLGRPRADAAPMQWITERGGRSLRVMMAGVSNRDAPDGYVLVIEDVTRSVEMEERRERLLQEMSESTRASLGNIRAAIETMLRFPDMAPEQRAQFSEVIRQEGEHLSQRLGAAFRQAEAPAAASWPLEDLPAEELGDLLHMALERRLQRSVGRSHGGESPLVVVDSQGLVRCMGDLAIQLLDHLALQGLAVRTESAGRFVRLALCWNGPPLEAKTLHAWRRQALEQVLLRHGAELWAEFDGQAGSGRLCLQLPAPATATPAT